MESIIKADIFFFVSTIALVVLSLLVAVVLAQLIIILRELRSMVGKVQQELDELREDMHDVREEVRERYDRTRAYTEGFVESASLRGIAHFMLNTLKDVVQTRRRRGRSSGRDKK